MITVYISQDLIASSLCAILKQKYMSTICRPFCKVGSLPGLGYRVLDQFRLCAGKWTMRTTAQNKCTSHTSHCQRMPSLHFTQGLQNVNQILHGITLDKWVLLFIHFVGNSRSLDLVEYLHVHKTDKAHQITCCWYYQNCTLTSS